MPSSTVTFFAVVGLDRGAGCDHDGCHGLAEFTVACADDSGALVADVAIRACPEHLPAYVREVCGD